MRFLHDATELMVVDLEATCDVGGFAPAEMEIIEIGAVVVGVGDWETRAEFRTFVRPVDRPALTAFCTALTSIRQEDVDAAPTFPEALEAFRAWYRPRDLEVWSSWGAYDKSQLRRDQRRHGTGNLLPKRHLNLKALYARAFHADGRRPGLAQALAASDLEFAGSAHRALDDARNTARLLPRIFEVLGAE
ncbi:MAG: 3'-5' exonuclease [Planctomycetota bacterium]